ncbi:MAG: NAD-dependent epimerase/dehydratase family protein [Deltaproteobacteria bacterium]|nr:NAD-dependent epimerase/dehydratase family protein [Deltaproteobacteria bacterium]
MSYLVTGGAGFIGSHLAEALLRRGRAVRVVDNLSTGNRQNLEVLKRLGGDLDVIEADLNDGDAARRACAGIEIAFHLAALPSVARSVEFPITSNAANVTATLALLCAARAAGVRRVVYAASSSAYGDPQAGRAPRRGAERVVVKRETMPPRPLSPYAVSKLAAEYYTQVFHDVYGLETVCLRYFNIFGPRQNPFSAYGAAIPKFVTAMLRDERPVVFGDGKQSRDFTYVDNAVRANLLAASAPARRVSGEVFNVACGRNTSLLRVIEQVNRLLGKRLAPLFAPPRAGDVRHSKADVAKAKRLLGYQATVSLSEGLERTIAWLREHT